MTEGLAKLKYKLLLEKGDDYYKTGQQKEEERRQKEEYQRRRALALEELEREYPYLRSQYRRGNGNVISFEEYKLRREVGKS
jgi:hypothetical protein